MTTIIERNSGNDSSGAMLFVAIIAVAFIVGATVYLVRYFPTQQPGNAINVEIPVPTDGNSSK